MKIIYFLLIATSLGSCIGNQPDTEQKTQPTNKERKITSNGSVYEMNMIFQDQDGKTVEWQQLKGKIQVMAMVFTHCEYACPRITEDMKNIQAQLKNTGDKVQYTLISFDVKRDTPARLFAYAKEKSLDGHWQLLHGSEEDVQIVSALLDVKYKPMANGVFSHENIITVINSGGEIVLQQEGLEKSPGAIVNKIKSLM